MRGDSAIKLKKILNLIEYSDIIIWVDEWNTDYPEYEDNALDVPYWLADMHVSEEDGMAPFVNEKGGAAIRFTLVDKK